MAQINLPATLPQIIGIRDFKLFVKLFEIDDFCTDNNIAPFDGCFSNYYDCIYGCENCIKGLCWDCLEGWEYQEITNSCNPYCGNKIITYNEECDDGNKEAYDGCYDCKYSCPKDCKICQFGKCLECENLYLLFGGRCLSLYIEIKNINQVDIKRQFNLKQSDTCYQNVIQNSKFFYILASLILITQYHRHQVENQQQHTILEFKYALSSDLDYLILTELGNQFQCVTEQILNCKIFEYGVCIECQPGYVLDFPKKQCVPKCQDGITLSEEVCDGLKSCQIECLLCLENKCLKCQDGWNLQEYQCIQICGDGQLAILSNEQCDDPDDSYCINCKYYCEDNCSVCDEFQNCQICRLPFKLIDGQCLPICGDKIITPLFEQCDDGNDIPYDGCFECQYQCSFGCIKCEKDNHCTQCQYQEYILDTRTYQCQFYQQQQQNTPPEIVEDILCNQHQVLVENKCVNQCGNGLLDSIFEQCDDGNNDGGDGCSAFCSQEESFDCFNQENQLSICTFIQEPNFNLIQISDKKAQIQIIELFFSQEVYLSSGLNFEETFQFQIKPETQIEFSVVPIQNISSHLDNPKYKFMVQFLTPVENPILIVNIQKYSIYNQYDIELSNNYQEILLGTPFVLSENNQNRVTQVIKMNDIMIYSTIGISGILFLTGNYIVFINLLDLLQTLSYIRYMQYRFPPHLTQFLEIYTKISLKPILDSLKVDELIAKMNGGSIPFQTKKSNQSNQTNVLNQFFLMNAKGCFITYIASILTYFVCCLISSNKVSEWLKLFFIKKQKNPKFLELIIKFQKKIQFKCYEFKRNYYSLGIFQVFYSSLHQLLFSSLLQFPDYTFNSLFEIINSIVALGSLFCQITVFYSLLSITTSLIKNKQKWKYFYQDQSTKYWAANFKSFQIFRIVSYITIIVELIKYPEASSIFLSMQSLFYLIYLIQFRPAQSKFDEAKLICRELVLLITTGTFLVYTLELDDDQFLFYGWIHIGLISFLMGFTLVVDIFEQGQKAYHLYLRNQLIKEKKLIRLYYENKLQRFIVYDLKRLP